MHKIYSLREKGSSKIKYVGYTTQTLSKRLSGHKSDSKKNKTKSQKWIKSCIDKKKEIIIEKICVCKNYDDMRKKEKYQISKHQKAGHPLTNSNVGGGGVVKHTAETKAKISEANKGKKMSAETRKKIGEANKGKKVSEEHKAKLSRVHKGKVVSAETRMKIGEANRGRKMSAENKIKLIEANTGRKVSAETRLKRSLSMRFKSHSQETIKKIAASLNGGVQAKPRNQIDAKTGKIIKQWASAVEASRKGGFAVDAISKCCHNKQKKHKGFA